MKYMMFVCVDRSVELDPQEAATIAPDAEAWVQEMGGRGVRLQGNQPAPVDDATTVRVRRGEVVVADGPFAETKEQIAGLDILQCADLDEAIEVASKHPVARSGTLELRPCWEDGPGRRPCGRGGLHRGVGANRRGSDRADRRLQARPTTHHPAFEIL